MAEKLYDVVVCDDANGKIVAVIGHNLNERQMEKRIDTGLMRVDTSRFFVKEVPAGQGKVDPLYLKN